MKRLCHETSPLTQFSDRSAGSAAFLRRGKGKRREFSANMAGGEKAYLFFKKEHPEERARIHNERRKRRR